MAANGHGLVIVGGGLASARAIKGYREAGGDRPLRLISADRMLPYHRPPLSKRFLRGESEAEDALVEPESFYVEHGVEVELETCARALRLDERVIELEGGGTRGFEQLLIATGATPRRLGLPGDQLDRVFTLRTVGDASAIREAARTAERAVVVGAGFIGMEVASSLTMLGVAVTLVHRGEGLFEVLRSPQLSQYLRDFYADKGVELVLGDEVVSLEGDDRLERVTTRGGRSFEADLAVLGLGVGPATEWLETSGFELEDGVVVNERFETGVEGVWAVGDVARFYDPVFRRHRRIEHWSNANYAGAEVGRLIAGGEGGFDIVSTFFSEVFGLSLKVFGDIDRFDDVVLRGAFADGEAASYYLDGDRFVACLLMGQDEETENRLKEQLAAGASRGDLGL